MYNQDLNQDDYSFYIVALNAAFVGSTDDTVLRFDGTPTATGNIALSQWADITTDAVSGTVIKITRRGLYYCELGVAVPADAVVWAGISLAANTAQRTANPSVAAAPTVVLGDSGLFTLPAATTGLAKASAIVPISQRLANGPATDGLLRFQCSNGSNAAPAAGDITAATTWCRVTRIADLNSAT